MRPQSKYIVAAAALVAGAALPANAARANNGEEGHGHRWKTVTIFFSSQPSDVVVSPPLCPSEGTPQCFVQIRSHGVMGGDVEGTYTNVINALPAGPGRFAVWQGTSVQTVTAGACGPGSWVALTNSTDLVAVRNPDGTTTFTQNPPRSQTLDSLSTGAYVDARFADATHVDGPTVGSRIVDGKVVNFSIGRIKCPTH